MTKRRSQGRALLASMLGLVLAGAALAPATAAPATVQTGALTTVAVPSGAVPTWPKDPAPLAGPRVGNGCSGDGTSGKRVQVLYAVSSDSPDRYAQYLELFREQLRVTDTVYQRSAKVNGGGSRQVRWVHDANCVPIIDKVIVPPIKDATGTHRVHNTFADTINTISAAGYPIRNTDRKYVVLVDYPGEGWDDPICGYANGPVQDPQPGVANWNNTGTTVARIDTQCWRGTLDPESYELTPTIAHELTHALGAVQRGAPNASPSSHCTDNADLMCYADSTSGPTREVCAPAETYEMLLDCGGDDYYNTNPPAGTWLAKNWNVANSLYLYEPPAPTLTAAPAPVWVPGKPATLDFTPNVLSGQGWKLDYRISQKSPLEGACQLSSTSINSGDPDTRVTLTCNAATTAASVTATVTQDDGRTSAVTTRLTPDTTSRASKITLTSNAATVTSGQPVTVTATVTDPATGTGVYGIPVTITAPSLSAPATGSTDQNGKVAIPVTLAATADLTVATTTTGPWQATSGTIRVILPAVTALTAAADPAIVKTGASTTLTGRLTAGATGVAGLPVQVWKTSPGTPAQVGTATTTANGTVTVPVTISGDATYQLRFPGTAEYRPSSSSDVTLAVTRTSTTTAALSSAAVPAGSPATVTATVTSSGTGVASAPVTLWFTSGTGWDHVASATANTSGTATFTHVPTSSGTYQVRYAGSVKIEPSTSSNLAVTVRQPSGLTLSGPSSAGYGATVTLGGTLTSSGSAAVAGQPVELWATPAVGARYKVNAATTSSTGTVSFQVLANGTATYQLIYAGAGALDGSTSPAVTVTVNRAVAATVTVPARVTYGTTANVTGQLTWSGTTTGIASQPVELWAAPSGGAYSKVATGTTNTTGQVTFARTSTATTSYQLRYAGGQQAAGFTTNATTSAAATMTSVRSTTADVTVTSRVTYNTKSTITGKLTWAGTATGIASQPVELWAAPTGKAWAKVATGTTNTAGQATFTVTSTATTSYQLRYAGNRVIGTVTTAAHTSASRVMTSVRATATTVKASKTAVTYGTKITVSGTLRWTGTTTGIASQPVELWGNSQGKWAKVTAGTTNSAGNVSWTVTPAYHTTYQLRYAGNRAVGPVTTAAHNSAGYTTKVTHKVSASIPTKVRYTSTYTLSGTVSPAGAGRKVSIVVNNKTVTTVTVASTGKWTAKVKFPKGYTNVYASLASGSYWTGSKSATVRVYSY